MGDTSELNLFVGDERAWQQVRRIDGDDNVSAGSYRELVPGGALDIADYGGEDGATATAETRRVWYTTPNVAGRGMTVTWGMTSPDKSVAWYGFGGTRRPGENFRGVTAITGGPGA